MYHLIFIRHQVDNKSKYNCIYIFYISINLILLNNYKLSSEMLQKILEKPLEKKAGRNYGPPSGKTLIYFIDDINMPEVSLNIYPYFLVNMK